MWVPSCNRYPSDGLSSTPRGEAVYFLARGGTKKQTAGCAIATNHPYLTAAVSLPRAAEAISLCKFAPEPATGSPLVLLQGGGRHVALAKTQSICGAV
jgi:hypothetical protein